MRNKTAVSFLIVIALLMQANAAPVSFDQYDWVADQGGYVAQDSDWGSVNFLIEPADISCFTDTGNGYEGYVNASTCVGGQQDNWAVQNLPLFFSSLDDFYGREIAYSVDFDLGVSTGTEVSSIDYIFTISPTPINSIPTGTPQTATVSNLDIFYGGVEGSSSGKQNPPKAKNFIGAKPGDKIGDTGKVTIKPKEVAPITESKGACSPAAVARSLKYLAKTHSQISISDSGQKVYSDLYTKMKTTTSNGTTHANSLKGKEEYVKEKKLKIKTKQQEYGDPDFQEAIEVLKAGGDVEMMFNNKGVGHLVFVMEIIEIQNAAGQLEAYKIVALDDIQRDSRYSPRLNIYKFDAMTSKVKYFMTQEVIPEPATLLLLGFGGLALRRKRCAK